MAASVGMGYIIQWTNKWSKESGYVESVNNTEKHFVNTFDKEKAIVYGSKQVANRTINRLVTYGEAENNDFELVSV